MAKSAILIVDDDEDDLMLIRSVAEKLDLGRDVITFRSGDELVHHLKTSPESPLLIISDVNLPKDTGFDLKNRLANEPELKYKSVPFIFWSTAASEAQIQHAYDLPAQGFFFKPSNFDDLCTVFENIVSYWQLSQHPKRIN